MMMIMSNSSFERDLYWSLVGPSMLDCDWAPAKPDWLARIVQLAIGTSPAVPSMEILPARPRRIGYYFESLWHEALIRSTWHWQANLQIISGQRTLGELDLLIQPPDASPLHLELAIKFYLGTRHGWLGPNARDSLLRKLHKLHNHQLQLPRQTDAHPTLEQQQWPTDGSLHSYAIMRGCLFYPAHDETAQPLPAIINPDHWHGFWVPANKAAQYLPAGHWYVLDKHLWCSPAQVKSTINRNDILQWCQQWFGYLDIPLCLARCEPHDHHWREVERWFVTPVQWPLSSIKQRPCNPDTELATEPHLTLS